MEELILNQPELIVYPEVLYKNGGLWFSTITDLPFTGRVEIYSDKKENIKILECTIVKGLKHGVFIQYFNQDTESLKCIYSDTQAKYQVIFARAY